MLSLAACVRAALSVRECLHSTGAVNAAGFITICHPILRTARSEIISFFCLGLLHAAAVRLALRFVFLFLLPPRFCLLPALCPPRVLANCLVAINSRQEFGSCWLNTNLIILRVCRRAVFRRVFSVARRQQFLVLR